MNSAIVQQQSAPTRKANLSDFGYEKKSDNSPSVQRVRAAFLSEILDIKASVVVDLFGSALQPFIELLISHAREIEAISKVVDAEIPAAAFVLRQPGFIRERAITAFIPDWHSLQQIEGAVALYDALTSWAKLNHLTDEWCLNHALSCLRAWDAAEDRKMAIALLPDAHFLISVVKRCWLRALYDTQSEGLRAQFLSNVEVEEREAFSFAFKYETLEFSVTGPYSKSPAVFKREVESRFRSHGGQTLRGARKALRYQLDEYLNKVEVVRTELGLEASNTRWAIEDHLNWLTLYQLPPCKTYRQIAREVKKDDRTVREGIQGVAALIGLTLRSSETDKHSGRPKGAKDRFPRLRVGRRQQKLRGNRN